MKTKTYFSLSAAFFLLLSISCQNQSNQNDNKSAEPLLNLDKEQKRMDPTIQEFKYTIPLDAVKEMINTYETERVSLINNNSQLRKSYGDNFVDSKNGWVSLNDLISFIDEVKADAKNKGIDTKDLGIRLYYTVYPQEKEGESEYFKNLEKEYRSKQTFLLLPTYHDPRSNSEKDVLSAPSNIAGKGAQQFGAPSAQTCIALNHMALCPPACPN